MLIHDADGNLLSYEKMVGALELDGDSLSGVLSAYIYGPDQNPLDPDENPIRVLPGTLTGSRICVETLGE
jgi:hypothetical protein